MLRERKLLVEILAFCLMPNHFHLLIRQLKDDGISRFMRKLGGYATYLNKKYKRSGHLYQGRFKAVHVESDDQLKNTLAYIHTNPISLLDAGWKESGICEGQKAIQFLQEYKWSSYLDYLGIKNYPSITNRDFLLAIFDGEENCQDCTNDWIFHKKDFFQFPNIILE